jgi:two-component system response regulator AtoC
MSCTVLIIDDEEHARKNISEYLKTNGYEVLEAGTVKEGKGFIQKGDGDIILLDVQLPDGYGLDLLSEISALPNKPPVILITGFGDIEMAVEAMKNGAHDFLTKPIVDFKNLVSSLKRAEEIIQMRRELNHYRQNQMSMDDFVTGNTQDFTILLDQSLKAAASSVSVLITGETGTGKEVLARFIHQSGARAKEPFIAINCAAIQPTVLESELFGYEKGAFTSADRILFLDEISSMPTDIQAKLLRAIEEQAFRRVGGTALIKVDVQVVAASNRNVKELIKEGKFREDLYYRLKVVDLHLPPLRERKNDIPDLVGFFIRKFNMQMGKNVIDISPDALKAMINYEWQGNIRELSNVIQRAMLFCDGEKIVMGDLPADITKAKAH